MMDRTLFTTGKTNFTTLHRDPWLVQALRYFGVKQDEMVQRVIRQPMECAEQMTALKNCPLFFVPSLLIAGGDRASAAP